MMSCVTLCESSLDSRTKFDVVHWIKSPQPQKLLVVFVDHYPTLMSLFQSFFVQRKYCYRYSNGDRYMVAPNLLLVLQFQYNL